MAYHTPSTLKDALLVLGREAPEIKVMAGGTDLVVALRENRISPRSILDISGIRELSFITEEKNRIRLGPMVTHAMVERAPLFHRYASALATACASVGSPQIRNRGTLGGNIANSSPAGDSIPALMALGADIRTARGGRTREIPIEDFFLGPGRNVLKPDEMITAISFTRMNENQRAFFLKLGQRKALSIAKVSVAVRLSIKKGRISEVRIALGSVAPKVILAGKAGSFLEGKALSQEVIEEASRIVMEDASPIGDIRSSAVYRKKMVGRLLQEGLSEMLLKN
jgi:CO/xanthine dehydrogenase FAD-binding subunit